MSNSNSIRHADSPAIEIKYSPSDNQESIAYVDYLYNDKIISPIVQSKPLKIN